jgi:hypothetical protein
MSGSVLKMHGKSHDIASSDPVPYQLPYAFATGPVGIKTIPSGSSAYLGFDTAWTNQRRTFTHMELTDPLGDSTSHDDGTLVILRGGMYRFVAHVVMNNFGLLNANQSVTSFVASGGSSGLGASMSTGSHNGSQGLLVKGITPSGVDCIWNVIDANVSGSAPPRAFKPMIVLSAGQDLEITGWAMSITRVANGLGDQASITEAGLPDGITFHA